MCLRIALLFCLIVVARGMALEERPLNKFLPPGPYSLGEIIGKQSQPFACSFGEYRATQVKRHGKEVRAKLHGKGILINSLYLTPAVSIDPDVTYLFPSSANIGEGMVLSVFCNDSGNPMEPHITFFVPSAASSFSVRK